ncbi:hypothetical protein C2G38_2216110 [Gigaspora rosea]|uniref:Uncharacterized protein n=1 Tax=Gigaspora rosea TaxID=44941 RepID=A0A397UCM8_9GLOM|nr:hypothetical protein C2G38_2216110 [Gigaspora rosea]
METINRRFAQLEHANLSGNEGSNNNTNNNEQMPNVQQPQQLQHQDQVVEQTPNIGRNLGQIEVMKQAQKGQPRHSAQFKASRMITADTKPYLQSVSQTIEAISPKSKPLTQEEVDIVTQLDPTFLM